MSRKSDQVPWEDRQFEHVSELLDQRLERMLQALEKREKKKP